MNLTRLTEISKDLVRILHEDLEAKIQPEDHEQIERVWSALKDRGRTAEPIEAWQSLYLEQVAVAWVITTLFVRYLEDNQLIPQHWIAGAGRHMTEALESRDGYFERHPAHSDADYLLHVFNTLGAYDAGAVFRQERNPLHRVKISGDAANTLLTTLQRVDDDNVPELDFRNPTDPYNTRFLGDLYQDVSPEVQKLYALCQTPDFIEQFILDHTLTAAIDDFGADTVTLIDPTCGSGHFVIAAFERLMDRRRHDHPTESMRESLTHVLARVAGVDINPFAAVITRFRLLIAVLGRVNSQPGTSFTLSGIPAYDLQVATGDSLLLGQQDAQSELDLEAPDFALPVDLEHALDESALAETILSRKYHAVVGNPPYITVKDKAQRDTYRALYHRSCKGKYALTCPFYERFHQLAVSGEKSGHIGQITSNSFMKREFGTVLIENIIPETDITHVIDTSGAYIPGHGTPTVILFSRNQAPVLPQVSATLSIRGEPTTPEDPAESKVWSSIKNNYKKQAFENAYISVEKIEREMLHKHPWTLKGGGALGLMEVFTQDTLGKVGNIARSIGPASFTGHDEAFIIQPYSYFRHGFPDTWTKPFILGESVRDYATNTTFEAFVGQTNEGEAVDLAAHPLPYQRLWQQRESILSTVSFGGKSRKENGEIPWTWYRWIPDRYLTPLSITFAFVATHNHFVLDRGGKVFNRTAPVIKLAPDATVEDHLKLLGPLNSSTFAFWGRMTFFARGHYTELWEDFLEHDSTKLRQFPLPETSPVEIARRLDALAQELSTYEPSAVAEREVPTKEALQEALVQWERIRGQMIALQEELDFACYEAYGLVANAPLAVDLDALLSIQLGERPFEISMAREVEAGELKTEWFRRHRSTPTTEIPDTYPSWYQELVQKRLQLMEDNKFVRLIEAPEYKRRWASDPWEKKVEQALESWLRNHLETPNYFPWIDRENCTQPPAMVSLRELIRKAAHDDDFMTVGALYTQDSGFDYEALVRTLIVSDSVPALPVDRFTKSGLKKFKVWEDTWEKQRQEDALDARGALPSSDPDFLTDDLVEEKKKALKLKKPPSYAKADFISKSNAYEHRGKLDVPKERYTLHVACELEGDGGVVVTWAGFDHRQRTEAIIQRIERVQNSGTPDMEQLLRLLAALKDLLPWLKQWHNAFDPNFGSSFYDAVQDFYQGQLVQWGVSEVDVETQRIGSA